MKLEELIEDLSRDLKAVPPLPSLSRKMAETAAFTLGLLALGIAQHGLRGDLPREMQEPTFILAGIFGLAFAALSLRLCLLLRIPGPLPRRDLLLTGLAGSAWIVTTGLHATHFGTTVSLARESICFLFILAASLGPLALLKLSLRAGATTYPRLAFMLAALSTAGTAAALLPLACPNEALLHLLFAHVLPTGIVGAAAWGLGRRFLRWS